MGSILTTLQQPEYLHVLINHLPVVGLLIGLLSLLAALVFNKPAAIFIGLALVALCALSIWPVSYYGEAGYDRVYSLADRVGDAYLKQHRDLAEDWSWLFYATGLIALAAIAVGYKKPTQMRFLAGLVVILAIASLIAGSLIAESGGRIRHEEFRRGIPPIE
ncbi:MAG: hypothetical protein WCO38_07665 [Verrucomicrobiota bacterium]|jgi:uncharacterized membrane protein